MRPIEAKGRLLSVALALSLMLTACFEGKKVVPHVRATGQPTLETPNPTQIPDDIPLAIETQITVPTAEPSQTVAEAPVYSENSGIIETTLWDFLAERSSDISEDKQKLDAAYALIQEPLERYLNQIARLLNLSPDDFSVHPLSDVYGDSGLNFNITNVRSGADLLYYADATIYFLHPQQPQSGQYVSIEEIPGLLPHKENLIAYFALFADMEFRYSLYTFLDRGEHWHFVLNPNGKLRRYTDEAYQAAYPRTLEDLAKQDLPESLTMFLGTEETEEAARAAAEAPTPTEVIGSSQIKIEEVLAMYLDQQTASQMLGQYNASYAKSGLEGYISEISKGARFNESDFNIFVDTNNPALTKITYQNAPFLFFSGKNTLAMYTVALGYVQPEEVNLNTADLINFLNTASNTFNDDFQQAVGAMKQQLYPTNSGQVMVHVGLNGLVTFSGYN